MNEFNAIVTEQVPAGPAEGFVQRVRIHPVDALPAFHFDIAQRCEFPTEQV